MAGNPDWGTNTNIKEDSNIIAIHRFKNWKILANDIEVGSQLPYLSAEYDTILFSNEFIIPTDSIKGPVFFNSKGFKGLAEVYLNDEQILKQINNSIPLVTQINSKILKTGLSKNKIVIKLYKDINLNNGFPSFTQIFTEPRWIGISKPFYLKFSALKLFSNLRYRLTQDDDKIAVNFNFSLNPLLLTKEKMTGLSLEQQLIDSSGKVFSRKAIRYSQNSDEINNKIFISRNRLWHFDNPQFVKFVLNLNRFGQVFKSDTLEMGLKSASNVKERLFFNFEDCTIKGINYYENLNFEKRSNHYKEMKENFLQIKNEGFNAIRFVDHIPNIQYLNLTDSIGLLAFIDLPIRRFPQSAFTSDNLLENTKNTLSELVRQVQNHPSFYAVGIGQEVLLTDPGVKKFFLILNESIKRPASFLTYLSPVPDRNQSTEMVADFYVLDQYQALKTKIEVIKNSNYKYALNGRTGLNNYPQFLNDNDTEQIFTKKLYVQQETNEVLKNLKMQGGFFESFNDWKTKRATHQTIYNRDKYLVSTGIIDSNRVLKQWFQELERNPWDIGELSLLGELENDKTTNFFSISMFFGSLIFLFFYKRYPRFGENYRRSLKHPYGFYVDMRERRIIPVFNSFMVGVHNSLILAVFFASVFYYWNDSFLAQEFLYVLFNNANIVEGIILISQSKVILLLVLFVIVIMHPLFMGTMLKILGLVSKNRIRLRQAMAIGLWSGAPLIFMLPLSLGVYHFLIRELYIVYIFIIFALFAIWVHFRLINGIRVLVLAKFRTIFILIFLSYTFPILIFLLFFSPAEMWSEYLITLLNSHALF